MCNPQGKVEKPLKNIYKIMEEIKVLNNEDTEELFNWLQGLISKENDKRFNESIKKLRRGL